MQCPRCGFDHSFRTCPNCGLRSEVPPPPPTDLPPPTPTELPPPPPPAGMGGGRRGMPWDRRAELGTVPAALETIKGVLFSPVATFREMRLSGDIGSPFLFALVLGSLGALAAVGWNAVIEKAGIGGSNPLLGLPSQGGGAAESVGMFCGAIIGAPIGLTLGLFVGSGIVHLCLMLFGGARNGWEATFRVYAYATGSTAPFSLIPACGQIIGGIWSLVATIIGLKQAHETDTWRVVCAVFLPLVVCCACIAVLAVFFGAALMALIGQAAGAQ